jgi:HAD superfamily hydrolase (TIGR01509 family)
MSQIKAVLFDVGNVLITWHPENLFGKLIPDDARRAFFLETVVPMDWHVNHDAGVTFAENRKGPLARFPEFADEIHAFDTRFEEMLGEPVAESLAVAEELNARGVPLYALTNMPQEKAQMVFSKISIWPYIRDVIISGDEKLIKPDPAIYELALRRMGLTAPEVFFTDDSVANIEAARRLGFVTHLFDTPQTLRPALVAAGVL